MTERTTKPQRELTDNRISLWLKKRLPERSPYVGGLLLLVFFALLPAMMKGALPDAKYLEDFGSYVGAVIGLGGLAFVTFWKHQKDWRVSCWEEDQATYIKVQALISRSVNLLKCCEICLKLAKELDAELDRAAYARAVTTNFELSFPHEKEWSEITNCLEGVNVGAQMYLLFCIGRAGEIWRMIDTLRRFDGNQDVLKELDASLSINVCEKVVKHLEKAIETLTGEAHFSADKLGINVNVLEARGGNWHITSRTPDPKYLSIFRSNRPRSI